ncbi:MAG: hemerythrin family protein [Bdellovibrionaceae bacterium]|jgi:hemerythrin-like metal-binding protein|nr:hemerythrin family protein [Pseudobdellovibrionaceae bacterium]
MSFFQWDPNRYSVDVHSMDHEHQEIIRLMNSVYEKNQQKKPKPEILKAMKDLANYTVKHFKDEEAFFSALPNYPATASHKKIHQDLLLRFSNFVTQYESGSNPLLPDEFFQFLKVWLAAHIAGVDRKYGEAAKESKKAS